METCRYPRACVFVLILPAKSEFKDDTIDLLPFFSPSAFTGYGDDTRVCLP